MFFDVALLGAGLAIKLLLLPTYHSTDFEVHRNWLAITNSLPVDRWYYENRSEWTLDYPPFFAWFEWAMSYAARWWDPEIVNIDNLDYDSWPCIGFQRATVIVSELVLYFSLQRFMKLYKYSTPSKISAALVFLSPGFLFIDHIHFQYNGFLFGMLVYSLIFMLEGRDIAASAAFAVLLCFKHIFMYVAPAYFIYLLLHYCLARGSSNGTAVGMHGFFVRLFVLGSLVIMIFTVAFSPFILMGQTSQLFSRLFPFKRGLCHAYWAPNFWALYAFLDRVLIFGSYFFPTAISIDTNKANTSTRGLVGDTGFAVLPEISPATTFIVTTLAQTPALLILWRKCTPERFIQSVVLCAYASFMFGWHVHEKAILLILIPFTLLVAHPSPAILRLFLIAAVPGYYSLFPLIFGVQELIIKVCILLIWVLCALMLLRSAKGQAWHILSMAESAYILGHIPLFVITEVFGWAFGKLEFLPLMAVSVYTAFGVACSWVGFVFESLKE